MRRVRSAAAGRSERRGGLDKGDLLLVIMYAYEGGLLKGRPRNGFQSRTSAQLRGTLRSRLEEILERLDFDKYSPSRPGFLRMRPPTRSWRRAA